MTSSFFQADSLTKEVKGLWELEINECNTERVRKCQGRSNKMALVSINCCVCVCEVKGWEATTDSLLYTSMIDSTPTKPLPIFTFNFTGHKCKLQNWTFFWLIKCPSLSPRSPVSASPTNYNYPQADKSSQSYPLQLHDWFVNTRKHPANHPLCSRWVLKKWKDIRVGGKMEKMRLTGKLILCDIHLTNA
jgi:hypothetical protein